MSSRPPQVLAQANEHIQPLDWKGWMESSKEFALEVQKPWADLLLEQKKTIDIRAYPLPTALLDQRLYIIESQGGSCASQSPLGNQVDLSSCDNARVVGWCQFSSIRVYRSKEEFENDETQHCVAADSPFAFRPGKTLYGWQVSQMGRESPSGAVVACRRMRSLFELVLK